MSEEMDNVVVLVDEDGKETEFEYLDFIEMNGNEYVVLTPYKEDYDEDYTDEEDVVIFRVEHNSDGEDTFISIEDEDEMDRVFEEFQARIENYWDFEEEEEDDGEEVE